MRCQQSHEEEGHRGLVEQAQAGCRAEEQPPARVAAVRTIRISASRAVIQNMDSQEFIERKPSSGEVLRRAKATAEHGQGPGLLFWTAERPGQDAGKEETRAEPARAERARMPASECPKRVSASLCLHGNERAVIDETPGEMAAAGDVIELIAKVAPARMGLVNTLASRWKRKSAAAKSGRET